MQKEYSVSIAAVNLARTSDLTILDALEGVGFDLTRLNGNVLEMPLSYCLDRLTAGEPAIIVSGLKQHGFIATGGENSTEREEMAGQIRSVIETDGYLKKLSIPFLLPETGYLR